MSQDPISANAMSAEVESSAREIVIEPTFGRRTFAWRELWAYRDLLALLVWRDYTSRYKQTVLGPLWFILQPLVTTIIFTVVFGKLAGIKTNDAPPMLFYNCGLLAWNYFAQAFNSTAGTLVNNAGIFSKVYFPRLIVPLAGIVSNLGTLVIQAMLFVALYVAYAAVGLPAGVGLQWQVVFVPLVILHIAVLSFGAGLWMAALTARYRDFTVLAGFLLQLWMYVSPLIYPLRDVPATWRFAVLLNPMAMPIEAFRHLLLNAGSPTLPAYAVSVCVTLLLLASGLQAFRRVESTFVDAI